MGKHRPIEDRMAQLQAQMIALQSKEKADEVSQDPAVQEVDSEISDLNRTALKWKRWAKDAPQKIDDFEKRVAEWEGRNEEASEWLNSYKAELADLKARRKEAVETALENME